MIKPAFLQPGDPSTIVGDVFGTPLVVKGWTGLPVIELAAWGILTWVTAHRKPHWTLSKQLAAGAATACIIIGSEWCHNLAHAAIAHKIGKPADAIRIFYGTPLLIYYDINDQEVKPTEHILRSVGGPLFNALMVPVFWLLKRFMPAGSFSHYLAEFGLGTNVAISSASLLPIPGIDGGPILKWSLVSFGHSIEEADDGVKKVNIIVGSGLGVAAGLAYKRHRKWLGVALTSLAATALAIALGVVKEHT